ncbi:MAG: ATP-binding protein [Deltaproteobacteria bacterium]|nr:ATP-binding protein [Deltaproteobacteria bacterium]MBW1947097.1 ATP-binding protein [Deltaproteobacteria bacterium]MBW1967245.1 ATP-binding protein [Deltaproteobacteria bacterium]MBW2098622.1 ATP-binding protein [Deltaproteobacteria bacterium]
MKLAVASGKGGTGKTTVSVSLALAAKGPVQLLDCDVEEPNAHIFLRPSIEQKRRCTLVVPKVIENKCTYCGKCRDICRFNAITVFKEIIMTFPELCHSCRGCFLICPEDALAETEREIGFVEKGHANGISFVQGRLRVGEAMSPPLIKAVKAEAQDPSECLVILDSPPGTSCPVIATVNDADYTLLVTEPTPFGLHDLKLAVGMLRKLKRPFGVILNRSDMGNEDAETWCRREDIPVHLKIPFDRRIAEGYARGEPLIAGRPDLRDSFESLLKELAQ